jgi:glycolate oxidase iron-sulfur subunit
LTDADHVREAAKDCVHCGFCLPACPTYQLWGEEMDSPRGRIHLVSQVLDGAPLTAAAASHFDRCLGCMACMTACPSGVRYDVLIEAAREWVEDPGSVPSPPADADAPPSGSPPGPHSPQLPNRVRRGGTRGAIEGVTRAAIFATFPYPRRLRVLTAPLRLAQRTGADRLLARSGLPARVSPAAEAALRLAPPGASRVAGSSGRLPERVAARGSRRAVAGMLTGCVQSVFFPGVNAATARVLAAEGCDVIIPRDQGCCGALSLHSGRTAEAARFARAAIAAFERAGVDAIVVNSAGCGSAMKEYERLLAGDPRWASRAAALSSRVRDLAEFLAELGPVAERHPLPVTAAYHDACHLGHAQRITRQPRDLLRAIPGLTLAELPDAGTCCGSAGVYNLLQPDAARALGERKADAVLATGAGVLVSANPGCTLQISAALAQRGVSVATAHTAEILDASVRGLRPSWASGLRCLLGLARRDLHRLGAEPRRHAGDARHWSAARRVQGGDLAGAAGGRHRARPGDAVRRGPGHRPLGTGRADQSRRHEAAAIAGQRGHRALGAVVGAVVADRGGPPVHATVG